MKPLRFVCLIFTAVLLSSCKIQITVPEGGRVESISGAYICESGDTCTIEVVDSFFDETFNAQPVPGFKFVAWRQKIAAFCGSSKRPCPLATTLFPGTPLMSTLESDHVFYLEPVFGRPNTWVPKARYPGTQLLSRASSCLVDGIIHVMDSWGGMGFDYDPASNTWARKNIRPSLEFSTSNAVNGKCYGIGGGYTEGLSGALFALPWLTVYDPKTDTSRSSLDDPLTITTIPVHRVGHGSAVVDGKVYVVGGASRISFIYNVPGSGGPIPKLGQLESALFIYDPVSDSWSTGSDMPTPRVLMGVTAMDGFIYAVGGAAPGGETDASGSSPVPSGIVERYDPAKDSWTTLASMPTKRWGLSVNAVDGALYAIGGSITSGWGVGTVATVERYNPKRDKWDTRADMSKKRWLHASQKVDGQIYVMGGWRWIAETSSGQTAFSTRLTEQYTP